LRLYRVPSWSVAIVSMPNGIGVEQALVDAMKMNTVLQMHPDDLEDCKEPMAD